jgi:hypothetical protein
MRRREFISLLTGTIAAWPLAAAAQQQKTPRLGSLPIGSPDKRRVRFDPKRKIKLAVARLSIAAG